jgi:predicted RNase H-like HicB family nuclease
MRMDIAYTIQIWREDEQFIAHAMPLDVMSSGSTSEEARAAVNEAVHLFLVTAAEMGTLEQILQEAGYQWQGDRWVSPEWVALERQSTIIAA